MESEDGAPAQLRGLQPEEELDLLNSVEEVVEEGRERLWKNCPAPSLPFFWGGGWGVGLHLNVPYHGVSGPLGCSTSDLERNERLFSLLIAAVFNSYFRPLLNSHLI